MLSKKIFVPQGVNVHFEHGLFTAKGKAGEVKRRLETHGIKIEVAENEVSVTSEVEDRKQKQGFGTLTAHIKNMLKGAADGYTYKLKVCYVHFPCTVKVEGDRVVIENFLGERTPRYANKLPGAEVKVAKQDITVTGADLDAVSQTAANIEQAARITGRDRRVFQDGVFITQKAE